MFGGGVVCRGLEADKGEEAPAATPARGGNLPGCLTTTRPVQLAKPLRAPGIGQGPEFCQKTFNPGSQPSFCAEVSREHQAVVGFLNIQPGNHSVGSGWNKSRAKGIFAHACWAKWCVGGGESYRAARRISGL